MTNAYYSTSTQPGYLWNFSNHPDVSQFWRLVTSSPPMSASGVARCRAPSFSAWTTIPSPFWLRRGDSPVAGGGSMKTVALSRSGLLAVHRFCLTCPCSRIRGTFMSLFADLPCCGSDIDGSLARSLHLVVAGLLLAPGVVGQLRRARLFRVLLEGDDGGVSSPTFRCLPSPSSCGSALILGIIDMRFLKSLHYYPRRVLRYPLSFALAPWSDLRACPPREHRNAPRLFSGGRSYRRLRCCALPLTRLEECRFDIRMWT